jgi:hypothetical protein
MSCPAQPMHFRAREYVRPTRGRLRLRRTVKFLSGIAPEIV